MAPGPNIGVGKKTAFRSERPTENKTCIKNGRSIYEVQNKKRPEHTLQFICSSPTGYLGNVCRP